MKILETFTIKGRGLVATVELDCNGPVCGDTLMRLSDRRSWTIKGIEWWALPRQNDPNGLGTIRPGLGDRIGVCVGDIEGPPFGPFAGDAVAFLRNVGRFDGSVDAQGEDKD